VAETILHGFNRHYAKFQEITRDAKRRFETADWQGEVQARKDRIDFYDQRVTETFEYINDNLDLKSLDKSFGQDIKRQYMWLLYDHKQPELAESFYNSVFCRLFDRSYFNNRHIFVKPGMAIEFLDMENPVYNGYYPDESDLKSSFTEILQSFNLVNDWKNLDRDLELLVENFQPKLDTGARPMPHRQIQVISSLFYRNKAAYIVGRGLVGHDRQPFVIPLLLTEDLKLFVDTIITEPDDIALIFSFTRAYFMVNARVPAGLVAFLHKVLPTRSKADIYTAIGFQKQGKTLFYREFLYHLEHSSDKLIIAPGIKGMVMSVFTLPSYPFVFKVIKDHFAPPKNVDRATVKEKYQLVKMHDRVGRMADTLEFSHVALPIDRFSEELLTELKEVIPSSLSFEDDSVIIRHLYIERRMVPFNIYLDNADDDMLDQGVSSYGNAIKDMIAANIFPGDMLLKNFGVTRHGRVIFYDYDEICHMTEIKIRSIPKARFEEEELSSEPWFHIGEDDFFPEQFEHFVVNHPKVRERFLEFHPELLEPAYWKKIQKDIIDKKRHDVFPYPQSRRFSNRYPDKYEAINDKLISNENS
jgi:isocitrate dehydrogenase kinase/phosphatase